MLANFIHNVKKKYESSFRPELCVEPNRIDKHVRGFPKLQPSNLSDLSDEKFSELNLNLEYPVKFKVSMCAIFLMDSA